MLPDGEWSGATSMVQSLEVRDGCVRKRGFSAYFPKDDRMLFLTWGLFTGIGVELSFKRTQGFLRVSRHKK